MLLPLLLNLIVYSLRYELSFPRFTLLTRRFVRYLTKNVGRTLSFELVSMHRGLVALMLQGLSYQLLCFAANQPVCMIGMYECVCMLIYLYRGS